MELVLAAGIHVLHNTLMGQSTVYGTRETMNEFNREVEKLFEAVKQEIKTSTDVNEFNIKFDAFKNFKVRHKMNLSRPFRSEKLLLMAIEQFDSKNFDNIEIIKRLSSVAKVDAATIEIDAEDKDDSWFFTQINNDYISVDMQFSLWQPSQSSLDWFYKRSLKRTIADVPHGVRVTSTGSENNIKTVNLVNVTAILQPKSASEDAQELTFTKRNYFNFESSWLFTNVLSIKQQSAFACAILGGKLPVVELFLKTKGVEHWPKLNPDLLAYINLDPLPGPDGKIVPDSGPRAFVRAFDYCPVFELYPYSEVFTSQPTNPDGTSNDSKYPGANSAWSCRAVSSSCLKACIPSINDESAKTKKIFWKQQQCYALHVRPNTRAMAVSLGADVKRGQGDFAEVVFPPGTIYTLTGKTQKVEIAKSVVEFEDGDQTLELPIVDVSSPAELPSITLNSRLPVPTYYDLYREGNMLRSPFNRGRQKMLPYEISVQSEGIRFVTQQVAKGVSYNDALQEWNKTLYERIKTPETRAALLKDFIEYYSNVVNDPFGFTSDVEGGFDLPSSCDIIVAKSRAALVKMLNGDARQFSSAIAFLAYPLGMADEYKTFLIEHCSKATKN